MSVDWMSCVRCRDTFCDCGDYTWCDCGNAWCSDECAELDGYKKDNEGDSSCKYCRKEDFEDGELLEYILKVTNSSRKDLIKKYKQNLNIESEDK